MDTHVASPEAPAGKQKLIAAALRLAAREGATLSSLGLRELAREAGLNHNTFYRHFERPEDLGQAAAESIATQLMAGMQEVRQRAARRADATAGAVDYFLDFVLASPEVFIVGARELHSSASPMRAVLQKVLESIAQESVVQMETQKLAPGLAREQLFTVALDITRHMFMRSLDLIEQPGARKRIAAEITAHVRRQFLGAMAAAQDPRRR